MASHPSRSECLYSHPSCGFICSPVWGGSFVNFLGPVKLQGWLQARCTANPQFLKLWGAEHPSNSYRSRNKAASSTPQPTLPVCSLDQKSALQCLKNVGLWSSLSIGRFSLWQSWLMWAKRLANLQASTLNAGVPTAPNLPESNCLYFTHIWSTKEFVLLVCLLHN